MNISMINKFAEKLLINLEKVIIGKTQVLELMIVGLLCKGHMLIEDVPGTGKTMLAKSMAISLGCDFKRIQFTPDMLPSDITGVSIFNQVTKNFEYRPGPIMSHIVLADEINRATPKTQSALLEAMEERQVTVDGRTHMLPGTFMVLATQNPIEYEGTFPLPEAQLDRFLMRIRIGYPSTRSEMQILESQKHHHPIEDLKEITSIRELEQVQEEVKNIYISDPIKRYVVSIIHETRDYDDIYLGASPRGSLGLYKVSQAYAALKERDYVIPDDIKSIAEPVLSHRLVLQPAAKLKDLTSRQVISEILDKVVVPGKTQ
jgi:MoxR-like ATPase